MSYQGLLTDAAGIPVADGPVDLTFKLYDAATDGTLLWEETQEVDVANGLFNVILGSSNPLNLAFDKPYWLGSTIGTDTELQPRTALTSSPYSLNSQTAGNTGDGHSLDAVDGDPTDVVFVDNNGKVGIGTANPQRTLHLKSVWDAIIKFESDGATTQWEVGTKANGDFTILEVRPTGGAFRVRITPGAGGKMIFPIGDVKFSRDVEFSGNVGIGTATPVAKLEVFASTQTAAVVVTNLTGSGLVGNSSSGTAVFGGSGSSFGGHFIGADNDGTKAAVKIGSGSQVMLLDGNEIDAMSGSLFLNNNSSGDVVLVRGGGNVIVSTTLVHSSDRRLKKNITTLDHALDKVLNLRGVSFEWKKEGARNSNPQQGVQIGFVAQEVETVVPELVKTDSEGYKSVAYANVTALLVEAVKGQQKTIAEQNTQLKAQNAQLKELRSRVNKLESQFSQTAMLNK